jgi:outer membrane protein TolC
MQTEIAGITSKLPMENISLVLGSMGLTLDGLQSLGNAEMQKLGDKLNGIGQSLVDALDTDTRHLFAGSIMVVQPVFLGGSIIALNKMADINEEMQDNSAEARRQTTLYNTDKVYWQVVSLKHKQRLAQGYLDLVQKLSSDVNKMIAEGVATRSD